MGYPFIISALLMLMLGCTEEKVQPAFKGFAPRPKALLPVFPIPGLEVRCRYELRRGEVQVGLVNTGPAPSGVSHRLYISRRHFQRSRLLGRLSVPLRRPLHLIDHQPGEQDLFLRVAEVDSGGAVLALSALCRIHSRIQLAARLPDGIVLTDIRGRRKEVLVPGLLWPEGLPPEACQYPILMNQREGKILFTHPVLPDGALGLVLARPGMGRPHIILGQSLLGGLFPPGIMENGVFPAYGLSSEGRHLAWMAHVNGDGPVLFAAALSDHLEPFRLTPSGLTAHQFAFGKRDDSLLFSAWDNESGQAARCFLHELNLLTRHWNRLHPDNTGLNCGHLAWREGAADMVQVTSDNASLVVYREGRERARLTVPGLQPFAGGALCCPDWLDSGLAVAFLYRLQEGSPWLLALARLDDEEPRVRKLPQEGRAEVLSFAVNEASLELATVERLLDRLHGTGQVRMHTPALGSRIIQQVERPEVARVSWSRSGSYLLVDSGQGRAAVYDNEENRLAEPELIGEPSRCWTWGTHLTSIHP